MLTRLDAGDDARFGRAVGWVLPEIERSLGPGVVANRAILGPDRAPLVRPFPSARAEFRRRLVAMLSTERRATVVVTDVRDCYPSMRPERVVARLREVGCQARELDEVRAWLVWFAERDIAGLPIGPAGSAILANVALGVGDEAARDAGLRFVRWVDDFVFVARSRRHAIAGLDAVRQALARSGLELHDAKTELIRDPVEGLRVLAGRRISFAGRGSLR